jgi:hypothetical protein
MTEEFLTDEQADLIANFVADEKLVEAVRLFIERGIYGVGVIKKGKKHQSDINWALAMTPAWSNKSTNPIKTFTPESVGMEVMVKSEALAELKRAFDGMLEFKKKTVSDVITNPAK